MKPDVDYLKKILQAFRDAKEPTTNIDELKVAGLNYEEPNFEFHLRLLADDHYVEADDGSCEIGLYRTLDGKVSWAAVPLRLTSAGHEFAAALCDQTVFAKLKSKLLPESIGMIKGVAGAFLKEEVLKHTGVSF